jgi:hypothetical protein
VTREIGRWAAALFLFTVLAVPLVVLSFMIVFNVHDALLPLMLAPIAYVIEVLAAAFGAWKWSGLLLKRESAG